MKNRGSSAAPRRRKNCSGDSGMASPAVGMWEEGDPRHEAKV